MVKKKKQDKKAKRFIVICVCGLAGTGKSTLAKKLAQKYGLQYYSGGDALKALAMKDGHEPSNRGWWETREGLCFIEERDRDLKFDKAVDDKLLEVAEQGNVVLDSWTMPWLLKKGFKIWLEASPNIRAERISKRDGISVVEALEALKAKERHTKAIYKKLYGFSLGEDFEPFHVILDTDSLMADETFQVLCKVINNMVIGKSK